MTKRRNYPLKALALLGTIDLFLVLYIICSKSMYLITGTNAFYFSIVLIYLPVSLTTLSLLLFLVDLLRHKEKNWFAFFAAFMAILPVSTFAIYILCTL